MLYDVMSLGTHVIIAIPREGGGGAPLFDRDRAPRLTRRAGEEGVTNKAQGV